ncbi:hypothetical protein C5C36_10885 [Rathayibacter sp. AY1G1]|uniref:hypothetical protein n=1 Tax=Rathayibacter sp. AY1G1 TaxID=2080564 RepID=UPI000CE77893|nr:hypothetical protein [Rathayibacter sp. AY1G1]PPH11901.1 hypothetical protein C5C36_10885 [Rathayibacter sp. AY1G1]
MPRPRRRPSPWDAVGRALGRLADSPIALSGLVLLIVWGVVLLATQAGRDAAALGDGLLLTLAVLVGGSASVALVIGGVDALWRVAVAPLAHVEAEATGGVTVLGRGRLGAGLRRVEPRFPLPTLRPYAVVVPRRRGLTVSFGDWGIVVPWARIARLERRWVLVGLRPREALEVVLAGTRRGRLTLVLVESPGPLGLRPAPETTLALLEKRIRGRLEEDAEPPAWGAPGRDRTPGR